MGSIARYFKFAERGTNIVTESRAGLTTFMVMCHGRRSGERRPPRFSEGSSAAIR